VGHVYHHFDRPTCAALSRKLAASLRPGGRAVLHEFLGDHGRARAMFGITMLAWTRRGEAYTTEDYRLFLADAGLELIARHDNLGMPTSLLIAEKP
jgi:hypothetical protein